MHTVKNGILSNGYRQYLFEIRRQIILELSNFVAKIPKLGLLPQFQYALLSSGKRLRPILVILSGQCVGGDKDKLMPLAIAFELMHTASLIHDDIIDGDELRRGVSTLHRKWSVEDAILAGDAMFALAINLAANFGTEIMKAISQSALELCDGEYMDLHCSLRTATQQEYFLKIKKKSAALFRASAYSGALTGGGSHFEIESLSRYGENFGIAYQLKDDLLDLTSSTEPNLGDLKTVRITLPLIHLHEVSDLKRREQLETDLESLFEREQSSSLIAVRRIQRMLREAGSIAYCKGRIAEYVQRSMDSITPLRENDFKSYLIEMVKSLIV